ncbi:MAG TPA: GNAT family N-acetyltransferase [Actinocrinis sp.]
MTINVRKVAEDEFNDWCDATDVGFMSPERRGEGPRRRARYDIDRCWGGFDGDLVVGGLRGLDLWMTVPGGTAVRTDGITSVTVATTHRRRGLLSRMMAAELAAAVERGEALSALVAAEWPIYGRFGFGAAAEGCGWHFDARGAAFVRDLPGRVETVDLATARAEAPLLYDRVMARTPGAVSRGSWYWDRDLNTVPAEGERVPRDQMFAFCRDERGETVGYAHYKFADKWTQARPDGAVEILDLFAVDVEYEARMWKFLADHDWVSTVYVREHRRIDELWRDLLVDRRAVWSVDRWDSIWIRVLDPVAALGARRYEVAGRIVMRITDKDGYADGTFVLEGGPDGAACAPTAEPPEVTLSASVLGSIYLGGFSAARFGRLGLIEEHAPGAVGRLAALFHTAVAPWAATSF